jgi:hypothetical protein
MSHARDSGNCFERQALVDCLGRVIAGVVARQMERATARNPFCRSKKRRPVREAGARRKSGDFFSELAATYRLTESVQGKVVAICASRCITPSIGHARWKRHLFCFANDVTDVAGGRRRFSAEEAS